MTTPTSCAVDVRLLCRDAARLDGSLALAAMTRLMGSLQGAPDGAADWSVQGSLRPVTGGEPEHWVHLRAWVSVPLQCQRCLQTCIRSLRVDRKFLFVADESQAERLDEELEDDVLVMPVRLDLAQLLEDELILALPLVPRHDEACPEPLPLPGNEPSKDNATKPFAALAALRGPRLDEGGS